jgi:hypothetical protein
MIRLEVENDGSGDVTRGNYDVHVTLPSTSDPTTGIVYRARVEGFERGRGWAALVRAAVEALEDVGVR